MAIISEFEEEEPKPSTSSSPPPKPVSFNASLDPSNPTGFLEKVFDFLAKESDFLGKDNVDKEIAAIVKVSKEKSKKKVEEVAPKVEIKKNEVKAEKEIKKEVKTDPMEVDKKEDKKEEETSSGLIGSYFLISFTYFVIIIMHAFPRLTDENIGERKKKFEAFF